MFLWIHNSEDKSSASNVQRGGRRRHNFSSPRQATIFSGIAFEMVLRKLIWRSGSERVVRTSCELFSFLHSQKYERHCMFKYSVYCFFFLDTFGECVGRNFCFLQKKNNDLVQFVSRGTYLQWLDSSANMQVRRKVLGRRLQEWNECTTKDSEQRNWCLFERFLGYLGGEMNSWRLKTSSKIIPSLYLLTSALFVFQKVALGCRNHLYGSRASTEPFLYPPVPFWKQKKQPKLGKTFRLRIQNPQFSGLASNK